MKRIHVILSLVLLAVIIGGSWLSLRLWRQQQKLVATLSGVPPIPNLVRWPGEMVREVHTTTDQAGRSRNPVKLLGRLAAVYHVNGFSTEARQCLLTLRDVDPANPRWSYLLADGYLRAGDVSAAEQALRKTVELAPRYATAWIRLGDLCVARGAFAEAEKAYTEATRISPSDVRAEFALISFEAWHGKRGDPRRDLEELVQANPEIAELHELLGQMHKAAGDNVRAAAEAKLARASSHHIETRDPWIDELAGLCFDPNRLGLMAYKLTRERRYEEAEELLKHAIELSPVDTTLRRTLSELYEKMDRRADARRVLEAAVRECRDDPKMPELLSRLLCLDHKPDEAVAVLTRALERWPKNAELRAARGFALRDGRKTEEALAELREAVALDPLLVEAYGNMGYCYLALNQRDAAKTAGEKAIAIRPNYAEALVLLGSLAIDAGDVAEADRHISRLYALQPDEPGSRLLFAALSLMKGTDAEDAGQLDAAAEFYRHGLEASPDLGPLLRKSSSVSMRQGAFADAVVTLQHYLKVEPADVSAYALLGEALTETDRRAEARKILEQGRALAQKAGDQAQVDEFTLLLQRTRR